MMRTIDADALEKAISVSYSMTDDYGVQTGYAISMKLIEDAPTIEPHRKAGKWIIRNVEDFKGRPTGKHFIRCDQCGEEEIISFHRRPFDFCPNCGADMI